MSDETPPEFNFTEALKAVEESTEEVRGLNQRLDALDKRDKKRKRQLRLTALSLLADIILTVFLLVNNHTLHNTQAQIRTNQIASCQANNVKLAEERAGIDAVIDNPSGTNAESAILKKLLPAAEVNKLIALSTQQTQHNLKLIATAWAPKDCIAAYPLAK